MIGLLVRYQNRIPQLRTLGTEKAPHLVETVLNHLPVLRTTTYQGFAFFIAGGGKFDACLRDFAAYVHNPAGACRKPVGRL